MTISVASSSSHHSSRSLEETSALLPTDTKEVTPRPVASARSSSASPSAPLCEEKPILPGGKLRGAKVALRRAAVEAMPRQLGPERRGPFPGEGAERAPLPLRAFTTRFGEARQDDDERADAGGEGIL